MITEGFCYCPLMRSQDPAMDLMPSCTADVRVQVLVLGPVQTGDPLLGRPCLLKESVNKLLHIWRISVETLTLRNRVSGDPVLSRWAGPPQVLRRGSGCRCSGAGVWSCCLTTSLLTADAAAPVQAPQHPAGPAQALPGSSSLSGTSSRTLGSCGHFRGRG